MTPSREIDTPESRCDDVAAVLGSAPPPEVSASFVARVSARIDAEAAAGWLGLLDYRAWTLRLAPIAVAVALILVLWPGTSIDTTDTVTGTATAHTFTPTSETDWQQDVSPDALLDAALNGSAR